MKASKDGTQMAGKASPAETGEAGAVPLPTPIDMERLTQLDAAFRYLLHAQVAHWTGEGAGSPLIATAGLQVLLNEFSEPHLGLITLITAGEPFFDDEGQLRPEVMQAFAESPLPFLDIPADEFAGDLPSLCENYGQAFGAWQAYAKGEHDDGEDLVTASWFLAGLDLFFRSFKYPAALSVFLEPPTPGETETLLQLRRRLEPWQSLLAGGSQGTRLYQPTFGLASQVVGGANVDLYFDRTLLMATFAEDRDMPAEAHQLVGNYVLAAMGGEPWPVHRLILYQARTGKMLAVDVDELRQQYNLKGFAYRLLGVAEKRYQNLWAAQGVNPAAATQKNIERHLTVAEPVAD